MSHIGKKVGRDWLIYYDGLYNPDVEPYTYYSADLLMDYDAHTMLKSDLIIGSQTRPLFLLI